ncbi:MAG: LysM peptidoglycan-binding domain-containing protein [Propionibacteriaceae bacterium]|nr:LysM peptidoglycan-binding domain-containing protein [Propionibacteriaceae bacterium]
MDAPGRHHKSQEGMMTKVRSVAASLTLVIMLFGVPWLLVEWGEWDRLREVVLNPSILLIPDDGHLVLGILTVIGAVAWCVLVWSVILEIAFAIRQRRSSGRRKAPSDFLRLPRGLIRPLVSAVFALSVLGTSNASLGAPVAESPAHTATLDTGQVSPTLDGGGNLVNSPDRGPAEVVEFNLDGTSVGGDLAPDPIMPNSPNTSGSPTPTKHIVTPGDSLWSIAEQAYGDGEQWWRIAQANPDVLTDTADMLRAGWTLQIPSPEVKLAGSPESESNCAPEQTVVIAPGDTLSDIAEEHLSDSGRWTDIVDANPALLADPDVIQPGWELILPCEDHPDQPVSDSEAGDSDDSTDDAETEAAGSTEVDTTAAVPGPADTSESPLMEEDTVGASPDRVGSRSGAVLPAPVSSTSTPSTSVPPGYVDTGPATPTPAPTGEVQASSTSTLSPPGHVDATPAPPSVQSGDSNTDPSSTSVPPGYVSTPEINPSASNPGQPAATPDNHSGPVSQISPGLAAGQPTSPSANQGADTEPTGPGGAMGPAPSTIPGLGSSQDTPVLPHSFPGSPVTWAGASALLAGGLVVLLRRRRLDQLRTRPLGRRLPQPSESARRLEAVLSTIGDAPVTGISRLSLTAQSPSSSVETGLIQWTESTPAGSTSMSVETILSYPTSGIPVCIGQDEQRDAVYVDVSGGMPFLVSGPTTGEITPVACGIAMNLAVESWRDVLVVHLVTTDELFATFDSITIHPSFNEAVRTLSELIAERQAGLAGRTWSDLSDDSELGSAWRPVVFCFVDPLSEAEFCELSERLDEAEVGVGAVATMALADASLADEMVVARLGVESAHWAMLHPPEERIHPLRLETSAPLSDLLRTTASTTTTSAWWSPDAVEPTALDPLPPLPGEDELDATTLDPSSSGPTPDSSLMTPDTPAPTSSPPPDEEPATPPARSIESDPPMSIMISESPGTHQSLGTTFSHPTLMLLGPIQLVGTQGTPPARAERSCMEYCGWLLEHPGTTAMAMSAGLLIAEGTRRSNMSRLRTWLGTDAEGKAYLPEAYSGRIWLDPAVTSDWQRLRLLIGSGIENTDTAALIQALALVRGAPLADAAPGQWHWIEEARIDMVCVIRDIGVVATRRCLADNDIDGARWAASRALVAAPEDEMLLCARLTTEHRAGNRTEVERLVSWITRNARNLGIDLLPDTVTLLQDVIERPVTRLPSFGSPTGTAPVRGSTEADEPDTVSEQPS